MFKLFIFLGLLSLEALPHDTASPIARPQAEGASIQIELDRLSAVKPRQQAAHYFLEVYVRKNNSGEPYFLKKVKVAQNDLGIAQPGKALDLKKKTLSISEKDIQKALATLKEPEKKENTYNYNELILILKADDLAIESMQFRLKDITTKPAKVLFQESDIFEFQIKRK